MHTALLALAALTLTSPSDDLEDRLDAVIDRFVTQQGVRGVAVVIDVGGERLYTGERGRIHFGGNAPADATRAMPAACVVDVLSSAYLASLAEEGELALDDELSEFLPGLAWEGHSMTLHHVLTHTSGLTDYEDLAAMARVIDAVTTGEDGWKSLSKEPLESTPGSCQTYGGSNVWLMGEIIEEQAGKPLLEVLNTKLLEPLGVSDGGLSTKAAEHVDEISVRVDLGGALADDALACERFGAGALFLSAADLARLARGLAAGDVVGPGAWARMTGVHRTDDGAELAYAYGLARVPLAEFRGYAFGGANGHEWVHAAHYDGLDLTLGVVADADDVALGSLERALAREVFDLPSPVVDDRPLPEGARAAYPGTYLLGCNRLEVRDPGEGRLTFHGMGRPAQLRYQGAREFVADTDGDLRLIFKVEEGRALSIVLVERGATSVAVRIAD